MRDPLKDLVREAVDARIDDQLIERAVAEAVVEKIASVSAPTGAMLLDMSPATFRREFKAAKVSARTNRYRIAGIYSVLQRRGA
jgi:hypothetical protein